MSGKRFTFYYERGNEVVIEDNGKRLSNKQLVDLLNELDEENEQLKRKLKDCEFEHFLDGLGSSNEWFGMGGF